MIGLVLLFFLALINWTQANAALTCSKVLQANQAGQNHKIFGRYLGISGQQETDVIDFQNRARKLLSGTYFSELNPGHRIEMRWFKMKTLLDQNARTDIKWGTSFKIWNFVHDVMEATEFVIRHYLSRRAWGVDFLMKLDKQSIEDADRSFYFTAHVGRAPNDPIAKWAKDIPLAGVLKIIQADLADGRPLPVEKNLDIRLDYNGGLKYEIGNFAISKEYNKEIFAEFLVQLMLHASRLSKEPRHDPRQMIYFNYADRPSAMMYKSLGFKPVKKYELGILKDGVSWVPYGITTHDILQIPNYIKTTRPYWQSVELDGIIDLVPLLLQLHPEAHIYLQKNVILNDML